MHDVIIIGGGIAGLTTAIYTVRAGLKTLLIEKSLFGGQMALTENIENYPGFESINGFELGQKILEQAKKQGVEILEGKVDSIENKKVFVNDKSFDAKAIVIAVGNSPKKLEIKGEKELANKGVYYCAICDGPLYKDKIVGIIGGGNSATKESLNLSKIAKQVYIINRTKELSAEKIWIDKMNNAKNITCICEKEIKEFVGKNKLEKLKLVDSKTKKETILLIDGVFIYIGRKSNTKNFNVKKDNLGYIVVDENNMTSEKGVFAVGDCAHNTKGQIATNVGDGAKTGLNVIDYINCEMD